MTPNQDMLAVVADLRHRAETDESPILITLDTKGATELARWLEQQERDSWNRDSLRMSFAAGFAASYLRGRPVDA